VRPRRGCLLFLLVLLALAGHVWYWYLPRLRPGVPDPSDLPGRLLVSGAFESCLWIPYPHQNLAAISGHLPDGEAFVAAAARLAGVRAPELPGFGPFAVPPADEITVCSGSAGGGGQGFAAAARIYPVLSWIAKAAGHLAGNPWLAGGTVEEEKRTVRVAWQGNLWTVATGDFPVLAPPATPPAAAPATTPPALAAIALKSPVSVFPAGVYRLRESAAGDAGDAGATLALDGSPAAPPELIVPGGRESQPILVLAAAPSPKSSAAAFALFPNVVSGSLQLPGAAAFYPPGGHQRWTLPAQNLMDVVTGRLPRGNAAGWAMVALDAASLREAEALAPGLARLVSPAASPTSGGTGLRLGLWVDPRRALAIVSRLRSALEAVPFLDPEQVRRWRDAETVLTPLARCGRAALATAGPPEAFTLRLSGCN
jgi:hypothetical protein